MPIKWSINTLKRLAGIPLTESYDEDHDDDLSSAEQELLKKAEHDLDKKGIKIVHKTDTPTSQTQDKKMSDDVKKDEAKNPEPTTEKKITKSSQAKEWILANPHAKRGDFIKHAEKFGMSKHYANAFFYSVKKGLKEAFVIVHPTIPTFMLAENRELNMIQWIDETSQLQPYIFETSKEANKILKYLSEWKSQSGVLKKVTIY